MSTNLITGYAGKSHITSAGDGAVNAAVLGNGRYVLDIAEKFAYELISNNQIRIKSGYAVNQGRKIELAVNDYEELTIDNGLQGVKRCDLIAITYEKNLETGIETAVMNVIKGTSGDFKLGALEKQIKGMELVAFTEDGTANYEIYPCAQDYPDREGKEGDNLAIQKGVHYTGWMDYGVGLTDIK